MSIKRIGILGAGNIATNMCKTITAMQGRGDEVCLYAVASRDEEKARAFAQTYGVQRAYGSYEAMMQDPAVDLIYIATPHAFHAAQMKACILHGKAVLCEKAFTGNAHEAEEVLALARERHVLCAEAIWTRYLPSRFIIRKLIDEGAIGQVCLVQANLGYDVKGKERIIKPELAGGALLDLGVYVLNFASMVLGNDWADVQSTAFMLPSGTDLEDHITLRYQSGATAQLLATAQCPTSRRCHVYGTKGYLEVDNVNNPRQVKIYHSNDKLIDTIAMPPQLTGFEDEVASCLRALEQGEIECPEMPHAEILTLMRQMDTLRAQWGMRFPFD